MPQRSDAEIEAALTAYHGADGWDHNDRADMRAALAAADAVAPPNARLQRLDAALRTIVTTWDDPGRCFTMDALGKAIKKASAILEWRQG